MNTMKTITRRDFLRGSAAFLTTSALATSTFPFVQAEESTGADSRYEKIVVGISADPKTLVPWDTGSGSASYVQGMIYESLFVYDGENYVGILAQDYEIVDDYTYDVHLYDYIHDSEGNAIESVNSFV